MRRQPGFAVFDGTNQVLDAVQSDVRNVSGVRLAAASAASRSPFSASGMPGSSVKFRLAGCTTWYTVVAPPSSGVVSRRTGAVPFWTASSYETWGNGGSR